MGAGIGRSGLPTRPGLQTSKRPARPQDALRGGGEREQAESGPPAPNTGQEAVLPRAGRELWRPQGPEKGTDQGFGQEHNHPSCLAPQGGERWQHLFLLEPSPAPLPAHSLGFRWQHRGLRGQRGGDGLTLRDAQAAAAPHPSGNETQGVLGTCASPRPAPAWAAQGLAPSGPGQFLPATTMSWQALPPARSPSLWPPTLLVRASQVPAAEFFLSASPTPANVRRQVGRSQMVFSFSNPTERTRLARFCAMGHRPRRVWAGRGRGPAGWLGGPRPPAEV